MNDPRATAAARTVANFLLWSSRTLRRLAADTGLSFVQLLLIRILEARGPMRMGAASDDLALSDTVMTGVVDRLEERGLVVRTADPSDRRAIRIGLTTAGRRLARSTLEPYERALEEIFAGMDIEAVNRFAESFERLAKGLPLDESSKEVALK
jgi:DNA-binding MarR family transcriptional regulator